MQKTLRDFTLLALIFFSTAAATHSFATENLRAEVEKYVFSKANSRAVFEVKYFPHNNPTINEYIENKARFSSIFNKVLAFGFEPKINFLEIGIAPSRMNGGEIVEIEGKVYISISASDEQIEGKVLQYFSINSSSGKIFFFAHNQASIEQFRNGMIRIENVLGKFSQSGLSLNLPSGFEIGIAPSRMNGGEIVEMEGRLYVSITASDEQIERYFIKFIRQ